VGPGKHDEHTQPHVVAAAPGMAVPFREALSPEEVRELAFDLELPQRLWGTEVMVTTKGLDDVAVRRDGPIWHLSFSLHPSDPARSDEQWAEIVTGAMQRMGFDADPESGRAGCPWVAVHHGRNTSGCDHVHVAVCRVRDDGSVAGNFRDRIKMGRYAAEIEDRDHLTVVQGRRQGCVPEPGRLEEDLAARRGQPETARQSLQRKLRAAAGASRDESEYLRRLRAAGVAVRPRFAKGTTSEVVGYSVGLRTTAGGKLDWFGAHSLAPDLSLPALRASWGTTEPSQLLDASVWTSQRPAGAEPGRESKTYDAGAARRATTQLAGVVDKLAGVEPGDPDWATAASDGAGILANLAQRYEAGRPGPLARASDSLAQAAQRPDGEPHREPSRTGDLRGVSAVAAQALLPGGPVAWLALVSQLARMTDTMARAEEARAGRLVAEARAGAAHSQLTRIHHRYQALAPRKAALGATNEQLRPELPTHTYDQVPELEL
jgi:hypothetical protein